MFRLLGMFLVSAALAGPAVTAPASAGVMRPDGPRVVTDNKEADVLYRLRPGQKAHFAVDQDMNQPAMALSGSARLQRS
jgi:hypothetical protein